MKKFALILCCLVVILGLTGCNDTKEEVSDNSNIVEEDKSYKIDFKDESEKINDKLTMKIVRVVVSNDVLKEESNKINNYLDSVINVDYKNFKEYLTADASQEQGYTFEYVYSLVKETDKYLIFKLDYKWQAGGPYPTYAEAYYMFHKENGEVVKFDELFTDSLVADKIYSNLVSQVEDIYTKYGNVYDAESNGLDDIITNPGGYVLVDGKLTFTLPKGLYTTVAYGTITIDIDENIYKDYIK